MVQISFFHLELIKMIEQWWINGNNLIPFVAILFNKRDYLLKLFDLSYRLIINILFLSNKRFLILLKIGCKIKLLQNKIDVIFYWFNKYTIFLEEFYSMIIYIIVWLVIFLNANIHLVFIDDFCVVHVLVNEVFKCFSSFLSQV
jgi:hypothetical protein